MAQFVAFHPDNETRGQAVMATLATLEHLPALQGLAKKHGLAQVQPDQWYPQQAELDLMRDVYLTNEGMFDIVQIGMRIPDMVGYGVEINTVSEALTLLDQGYKHNHRGVDVGSFSFAWQGERKLRLTAHTPYPSDLEFGVIFRLVQKYRPQDSTQLFVELDDRLPNRRRGDGDRCVFDIAW